jgi:hypothetical protein
LTSGHILAISSFFRKMVGTMTQARREVLTARFGGSSVLAAGTL